jgi:hypothetical protein
MRGRVKDAQADADAGSNDPDEQRNPVVTTRKRLRSNEIALIGIVLLALGIAVLAGAPRLGARVALSSALWAGALGTFVAARRAGSALDL